MTKPFLKTTLFLVILLGNYITSNAQTFNWAKSFGSVAFDNGYGVAVDASGNVYTTGAFMGPVDFDPDSLGTFILNSAGPFSAFDVFISKLDSAGNFIWAVQLGGPQDDEGRSIKVDDSGNIYITGDFNDTADFDPGAGTLNLISTGYRDIFVAKLDTAGNLIWAKGMGGNVHEYASSIDVDASGNVYTTGDFTDTVDFDPGPGVFNLINIVHNDVFILKLDPAGNFVWAKQMGGTTYNYGYGIKLDAAGNVYTTGSFTQTVDFDPGVDTFNLISAGYDDIFVSKLDTAGNFIWARNMGGISHDYSRSIAVDALGNVYTTGTFESFADFDPDSMVNFILTQSGIAGGDIFVSKLDASGNFVWAKQFGGTGYGYGASIALDAGGNIYSTGYFDGVTDFDPGAGVLNFSVQVGFTGGDIYISKLNPSGDLLWAKRIGGNSYDYGRSIIPDAFGNVYATGSFRATVDFDPGTGIYNLVSAGVEDIFVCKFGGSLTATTENDFGTNIKLYPNPTSHNVTIELQKDFANVEVIVKNIIGEELFVKNYPAANKIDLDMQAMPGIYFIELRADDQMPVVMKLIKQ